MRASAHSQPPAIGSLVAGRYRIEEQIARGGMGVVYRAYDTANERPVALKRLRADEREARREHMFEHEYHTLLGLQHPRIIEVYDWGRDANGPFYTMELLDGRDLRELSPLPFVTACRYLRDVALSLALLHSRKLLHRDLSPGNVRVTSDDRAKLIDFGALAVFGAHANVVGTPPFIPPEALERGTSLDHLADLFSLGALAYWTLTSAHAFPARTIDELPANWRDDPPPPSEVMAATGYAGEPIPALLDELVLSLLSRNPLARPASAAEVIARLNTAAGLEPEQEPLAARSYLLGGSTVGRARERARLGEYLEAAMAGRGSMVLIEAESGMGSGRMLRELVIEAKLAQAVAVVVDAGRHPGPLGVAREIARELLLAAPVKAREAMEPYRAALADFMPGQVPRASGPASSRGTTRLADPREDRLRIQIALSDWITRLSSQIPLLVAVRSVQRADQSSLALLISLARKASDGRLLLALTRNPEQSSEVDRELERLRAEARRIDLAGLDRKEVRAFVESLFGRVQNLDRLAEWLYRLTAGNPRACLDLVHHLVDTGVIRFNEGVWAMPTELEDEELPSDIEQAFSYRIDRMSEASRRLARALCVHRGGIRLDRCLELTEMLGVESPFEALDELTGGDVLAVADDRYFFRHEPMRQALLRKLDPADRQSAHARLGRLFLRDRSGDTERLDELELWLDAGFHLLYGGEQRRGSDLLAEAGLKLSLDANSLPTAVPALRAALESYRVQGRSEQRQMQLLGALTLAGFYSDRKLLDTYGEQTALLMQRALGISRAETLQRRLGYRLGLVAGMAPGLASYVAAQGARGLAAFREAVATFATVVTLTTSAGTISLDNRKARRFAELMRPLSALGPDNAATISFQMSQALVLLTEDRVPETIRRLRVVLARLDSPKRIRDLPSGMYSLLLSGALYALGTMIAFTEKREALDIADRLDALGLHLGVMFADQVRTTYYAMAGEVKKAEHYRQRVETYAVQSGAAWQADTWAPAMMIQAYELTGDMIGSKRVSEELERLAREFPSLGRWASLSRASYHRLRGDNATAQKFVLPIIRSEPARSFIGWSTTVAGEVEILFNIGQQREALEMAERSLAMLDREDRLVTAMVTRLFVATARARAATGDLEGAARLIDDYLIEIGEQGGGPASRGSLHEARALFALSGKDAKTALDHLRQMERLCLPTENPALIARCERLRRKVEQASPLEAEPVAENRMRTRPDPVPIDFLRSELGRCTTRDARFDRALCLLLEHTGSPAGYLFRIEESGQSLIAPTHGDEPSTAVLDLVGREARAHLSSATSLSEPSSALATRPLDRQLQTASENESEVATRVVPRDQRKRYETFPIIVDDASGPRVVAAAVLATASLPLVPPAPGFLAVIAEAIQR